MIPASVTLKGIYAALIALALAVLLALLAVQTIRIEGLKIWPLEIEGLKAKVERHEAAARAARDAYKAETQRRAIIATDYEREASNAAQVHTIREREIRTVFQDVLVPAECAAPDDARRVLAEAVAASNAAATGQPVIPVPTASAPAVSAE